MNASLWSPDYTVLQLENKMKAPCPDADCTFPSKDAAVNFCHLLLAPGLSPQGRATCAGTGATGLPSLTQAAFMPP